MKKIFYKLLFLTCLCFVFILCSCDSNNTSKMFVEKETLNFISNKQSSSNSYDLVYSGIDSNDNCYYTFDLGLVKNVPVDSSEPLYFRLETIMDTNFTFETTTVTTTSIQKSSSWVENRLEYDHHIAGFNFSMSQSITGHIGASISKSFGMQFYQDNTSTTTSTGEIITSGEQITSSKTINVDFSNITELGDYRISNVMDFEVFVIVVKSPDGTIKYDYLTLAKSGVYLLYEFSTSGFDKKISFDDLSFDCTIVNELPKPTQIINVDENLQIDKKELVVFDAKIYADYEKLYGSGREKKIDFTLIKSYNELLNLGYKQINIHFTVDLKEVDNCYQYITLFNNDYIIYEQTVKDATKSWKQYSFDKTMDLKLLYGNTFAIRVKAENKIFKDFYVGSIYVKVTATQ